MNQELILLGGLPRSGATVLSSILNQNPDIYCSPNSILRPTLELLVKQSEISEDYQRSETIQNYVFQGIEEYIKGYYKEVKQPYIIDRDKLWGINNSVELIKKYRQHNVKVIFTVRDIASILTSFLIIYKQTSPSLLDIEIHQRTGNNEITDEARIEYMLGDTHVLHYALESLKNLLNDHKTHLIDYDDLINNPEIELRKMYDYLEMPCFNHNFQNISKKEIDKDEELGLPKDLHKVRQKLEKTSFAPEHFISPPLLLKANALNFWKSREV